MPGQSLASSQSVFLHRANVCIQRYQEVLENAFEVHLGPVTAKPLRVGEVVDHAFHKAADLLHRNSVEKTGREPSRLQLKLLRLETQLISIPARALLYVYFRCPSFLMKWRDVPPTILVSFYGWKDSDYARNAKRLDQWIVHELAHGLWWRLANGDSRGRRWRVWNEGFAHYIADIHLRESYPPSAVVDTDWSALRLEGKRLVNASVKRYGTGVLREIPLFWRELDARLHLDS